MAEDRYWYRSIPALAAYIDRIEAVQKNFRRFMVLDQHRGYEVERAVIRITDDRKLWCSNKNYAPTDNEQIGIEAALMGVEFPKSVGARTIEPLEELPAFVKDCEKSLGPFFTILDSKREMVLMVQIPKPKDGVGKYFSPWTLFSDGEWRNMEPDGLLPFWKPDARTKKNRLMIHEGAKAAKHVTDLLASGDDHPWREQLDLYEHWGMLGGAMAPHRAEYEEVKKGSFKEVVYACDNDPPGQRALQDVSRSYGKALLGLRPDDNFPDTWDMADPMPKDLFEGRRYIGPELKSLMVAATWATDRVAPKKGKAKGTLKIRREFADEWTHIVDPELFIHNRWPNKSYSLKSFNNAVKPYSDAADTAELLKADDASKVRELVYSPAIKERGVFSQGSHRCLNTYVPSDVKPEKGDASPWTEFMEHLFPIEEDRMNMYRWVATLVSLADLKMHYGVLLISETQGVGKGTLGEKILAPLVGLKNTSFPSEKNITESSFNEWIAHKRYACCPEIYAGHSKKAYNDLKSVMTDQFINVNQKYLASYKLENWLHVLACSNSMRALQLDNDDRRWFVPKVVEVKRSASYWTKLNLWLTREGGLQIIRWWCDEFVKKNVNVVFPGEAAPATRTKQDIIDEGNAPPIRRIVDIARHIRETVDSEEASARKKQEEWRRKAFLSEEGELLILDVDVIKLIGLEFYDGKFNDRLPRPLTVRKIFKKEGFHIGDRQIGMFSDWTNGSRMILNARTLCTTAALAQKRPGEICTKERKLLPLDVVKEFTEL